MRRSKAERAAAEISARDPHKIANASRLGNSDANRSSPKAQPSRPPTPKQAARDLGEARRWRDAYRAERERAKAATAAAKPKPPAAPRETPIMGTNKTPIMGTNETPIAAAETPAEAARAQRIAKRKGRARVGKSQC